MPPQTADLSAQQAYQRLVSAWGDLETSLSTYLHHPHLVQDFSEKTRQLRQWLHQLLLQDSDTALYLMFQLAATSTAGYSASHALVCTALCKLVGQRLALPAAEQHALSHAALTMNLAMTDLQDALALQSERPGPVQQKQIRSHAALSAGMLEQLGVRDGIWLEVVRQHHEPPPERLPLQALEPARRLTRILASIDRYAAMISPRKSRPGRTVAESLRAIMGLRFDPRDEVGQALVDTAGLYPPGTLVRLDSQEIAIVLHRSPQTGRPIVAGIVDANGRACDTPPLYQISAGSPRIVSGVPWAQLPCPVSHRTRLNLGLFTLRQKMHAHS